MAKRGKLNKVEIHYIESNPENLTVAELAKALDRSEKQVSNHYVEPEAEASGEEVNPGHIAKTKKEPTLMRRLMGRKERNGKPVASVMTPMASELSDERRAKGPKLSKETQQAIHRPLDD